MPLWPRSWHGRKHSAPRSPEQSLCRPVPEQCPAEHPAPSQSPSAACRPWRARPLEEGNDLASEGAQSQPKPQLQFCRETTKTSAGVTFSLPDSCTKGNRSHTNLEEYLDWQWSSSLSSSLWHSSQWPKENYKYQGLDFVWNWYIALWGKKSNGRTDRADRQSCPSNSNLTGSKYTHLVADSSQQEMPPISSINLFPWLFVYWQPNSSTHPFPLYPKGSKCKWKTSLKPKRSQHSHYPW